MKTSKEFYERLQNDEAFTGEVSEKIKEKIDAGQSDYKEVWIPIADEYGYKITAEEPDEMHEAVGRRAWEGSRRNDTFDCGYQRHDNVSQRYYFNLNYYAREFNGST